MDLDRFRDLVAAYGAEPRRWPPDERDAAVALLAQSDEARRLADEAQTLDRLLDAAPDTQPGPGLATRIVAHGPAPRAARGWWPFGELWPAGATLAAAVVLGLAVGALGPVALDGTSLSEAEVAALAYGPSVMLEDAP